MKKNILNEDLNRPWYVYKLISDQLLNFEKEVQVEKYEYEKIKIWPLYRFHIFQKEVSEYKYKGNILSITETPPLD